jgi:hypothetical protein
MVDEIQTREKRNVLSTLHMFELMSALKKAEPEIIADKLGYSQLLKRFSAELGFVLTKYNIKKAAETLGIKIFRRYSDGAIPQGRLARIEATAQEQSAAIANLAASVADLRQEQIRVVDMLTSPTGTRYRLENGRVLPMERK